MSAKKTTEHKRAFVQRRIEQCAVEIRFFNKRTNAWLRDAMILRMHYK